MDNDLKTDIISVWLVDDDGDVFLREFYVSLVMLLLTCLSNDIILIIKSKIYF